MGSLQMLHLSERLRWALESQAAWLAPQLSTLPRKLHVAVYGSPKGRPIPHVSGVAF